MIEVRNLVKRYGQKFAVNDISFTVNQGEIVGFLGPNGAGKSTTMNIITGYISSSSGTVTVDGADILEEPQEVKSKIGYLPEQPPLYLDMTVKEYLSFMYDLKKAKQPKNPHIREICELVKITDVYNRMIKNLSKGYRQRVGIAQALIGNPPVLVLDEPTVGLDPNQIIEIRSLIKELGARHTVILSSHILPEVQAVCDRIIVISQGKLVADDRPENLSKALSEDHRLNVRIAGPEEDIIKEFEKSGKIASAVSIGTKEEGSYDFMIEAKGDEDIRREVFKITALKNWPILLMKSSELTLEEVFLQLTSGERKR